MCTIITTRQKEYPKTATKDIEVYKCGYNKNDNLFHSPCKVFEYVKDKLYETEFTYDNEESWYDNIEGNYANSISNPVFVAEGFHAFVKVKQCRKISDTYWAKFIIPKGAKYYQNPTGCIVSNKIIFKKFI